MDEALKQKVMVAVIAGGLSFMVVKMIMNPWGFDLWSLLGATAAGAIAAGIGFGVVHVMNK